MAKTKPEIQYQAHWILRLIVEGVLDCLPVYMPRGGIPTVICVFGSIRRRGPFRRKSSRKRNNLATIPTGFLIARWVPIGEEHPLWFLVEEKDSRKLSDHFIRLFKSGPKILIYQLVRDWSSAMRQTEYIFANYKRELDSLSSHRAEMESRLHYILETLDNQEDSTPILREARKVNQRILDIRDIGSDRAARDFAIQFTLYRNYRRLQEVASGLEERSKKRHPRDIYTRGNLAGYLSTVDRELGYLASKEIIPLRSVARKNIHYITNDTSYSLTSEQISIFLARAENALERAGERLKNWSQEMEATELAAAGQMRMQFGF